MIDQDEHAQHDDARAGLAARMGFLLERQQELLGRLDEMSRRQMGLIEAEQAERLLGLIGERQHVIDQIQKSSEHLAPLRALWSAGGSLLPQAEQDAVRRRLDAVSMLIDQINTRDEEARRQLSARRDRIASELMNLGRGRGAFAAYSGAGAARGASFQDREA
jgi:hypothetical protein